MELVIDNTKTGAVTEQALTWPEKARAVQIADRVTYERAASLLLDIKALRGEVNAAFDPIISDAHRVHKTACGKKQEAEAPLVEAERVIKSAMADYSTEQERLRVAEERRLQDLARQQEEARRLDEAAALEMEGHATNNAALVSEAQELIAQPIIAPAIVVAKTTPKVAGIVHRDAWSARVTDLMKLVKYVAAHPEHQNLLQANVTALNGLARALKGNLRIDGVQAINTPTVAASGR